MRLNNPPRAPLALSPRGAQPAAGRSPIRGCSWGESQLLLAGVAAGLPAEMHPHAGDEGHWPAAGGARCAAAAGCGAVELAEGDGRVQQRCAQCRRTKGAACARRCRIAAAMGGLLNGAALHAHQSARRRAAVLAHACQRAAVEPVRDPAAGLQPEGRHQAVCAARQVAVGQGRVRRRRRAPLQRLRVPILRGRERRPALHLPADAASLAVVPVAHGRLPDLPGHDGSEDRRRGVLRRADQGGRRSPLGCRASTSAGSTACSTARPTSTSCRG